MQEPKWLNAKVVLAIHDVQLSLYGGLAGVRDFNLLESALARPKKAWAYEDPQPDLFGLAAWLIVGIARNHPFNDANKRTSLSTGLTFLELNGMSLDADNPSAVLTMIEVAQGNFEAPQLATWLRAQPTVR